MKSVEELSRLLRLPTTTRQAFDWPFSLNETKWLLLSAYRGEVESRGHKFVLDEGTKHNLAAVCNAFYENRKTGMLICGQVGNGKTTMLKALNRMLNLLWEEKMLKTDLGLVICDATDLRRFSKDNKAFQNIKQQPMLGLEDIGREQTEVVDFGNLSYPFAEIIEYRYDKQLYTLITTNLTPKEITEKYGERIGDRLREMVDIVVFENPSYR